MNYVEISPDRAFEKQAKLLCKMWFEVSPYETYSVDSDGRIMSFVWDFPTKGRPPTEDECQITQIWRSWADMFKYYVGFCIGEMFTKDTAEVILDFFGWNKRLIAWFLNYNRDNNYIYTGKLLGKRCKL